MVCTQFLGFRNFIHDGIVVLQQPPPLFHVVCFQNLLTGFLNGQFRGLQLPAVHHRIIAVVEGVVPSILTRLDGKVAFAAQFPRRLLVLCLNLRVEVGMVSFHDLGKLADVEHIAQTAHVKVVIIQMFQPCREAAPIRVIHLNHAAIWNAVEIVIVAVDEIYSMAEEGLGLHRIAKRLHDEKVLKPCYYKKEMFGRFIDDEKMYDWDSAYISQVLHSPVYAGHIIYEAKPTVSMKSKKRRYIPFEERAIVPNTHEAIIPQDRWENVQRILYGRSSSFMCDKTDYDNIFKGIVRCADCGRTMLVKVEHRRKRNSVLDQTFYCCSTYRKYGAKACDSHNLEARVLHEAVLADIQAHAKAAVSNREALVKKIANQMHLRVSSDRAQHKRDLKQCKARIAEIEDLYAKLYENVSKGLLPEKRFQMLADRYDKEQAELTEKIEQYEREGRAEHDQLDKIQDFIDEVSKYAGITELNYKILHQLIDKILVSKAEKVDGEYVQKIQIFYRFIGPLDAIE